MKSWPELQRAGRSRVFAEVAKSGCRAASACRSDWRHQIQAGRSIRSVRLPRVDRTTEMTTIPPPPHIVIVGGGLAGLAVASSFGESRPAADAPREPAQARRSSELVSRSGDRGARGQLPARQYGLLHESRGLLPSGRDRHVVSTRARAGVSSIATEESRGFRAGWAPAPFHLAGSFLRAHFLSAREKLQLGVRPGAAGVLSRRATRRVVRELAGSARAKSPRHQAVLGDRCWFRR